MFKNVEIGIQDQDGIDLREGDWVMHDLKGRGQIKYEKSCGAFLIFFEQILGGWTDFEEPMSNPKGAVSSETRKWFLKKIN